MKKKKWSPQRAFGCSRARRCM